MTDTPRYTLTYPDLPLPAAELRAESLENHFAIDALAVTINETDETRNLWEAVAYFNDEAEAIAARDCFDDDTGLVARVPEKDWVRESLAGLAPVVAGRFFLHGSHDRHVRREGGVSLEIDAGTAFGTGHHGTTEGCLNAFHDIIKHSRPARILDLGCGTGVLGIAAAAALKTKTLVTDIDAEAVRVSILNAKLNGVGSLIQGETAPGLKHMSIAASAPYDLIFANILARPLISLAQGLTCILAPRGHLILSGLTRDQMRWVSAAYRNRGLISVKATCIGNWATLVFQSPAKTKRPKHLHAGRSIPQGKGLGWQFDI